MLLYERWRWTQRDIEDLDWDEFRDYVEAVEEINKRQNKPPG